MEKNKGLYAGAGTGKVILPQAFFLNYDDEGNLSYEDGFTGEVYTFEYKGDVITDDPMARVLVLEDGIRTAIVSLEIAQTPADLIREIKQTVSDLLGVEDDHIWVHTTHSFGFMHRPGDAAKYDMFNTAVLNAVKDAAKEAGASFQKASLAVHEGECHVSANKNITRPGHPGEGPFYGPGSTLETDPLMTVIILTKEDGDPLCSFISYDVKPSSLCTTGKQDGNRKLNSEVPGIACKVVEYETGAPCLFAMSAAGDQYPVKTAQYYGYDDAGNWKVIDIGFEKGILLTLEQGLQMAEDVLRTYYSSQKSGSDSAPVNATAAYYEFANKAGDGNVVIPVEFMTAGDIAFVGVKQETDCISAVQLREASPYRHTLMVSFLNGDGKYMPHKEAYDYNEGAGTWEAARSACAPGAAEEFVKISVQILKAMYNGQVPQAERPAAQPDKTQKAMASEMQFAGIPWYILENKNGSRLLLSKYVTEIRPYSSIQRPVTWADSDLRSYLNGEFIEKTFSDAEKAQIKTVVNTTSANSKYGISGGKNTEDKVFALSIEEAELYLGGFADLIAGITADGRKVWWHLRTPGEALDVNACVDSNGMIDYHGMSDSAPVPEGGVRPAIWISE